MSNPFDLTTILSSLFVEMGGPDMWPDSLKRAMPDELRPGIMNPITITCEDGSSKVFMTDGEIRFLDPDGKFHRDDKPALIRSDGTLGWHFHGPMHRVGAPALIRPDGTQEYYQHGQRHRKDLPAVVRPGSCSQWWEDDKLIRVEDGEPKPEYFYLFENKEDTEPEQKADEGTASPEKEPVVAVDKEIVVRRPPTFRESLNKHSGASPIPPHMMKI